MTLLKQAMAVLGTVLTIAIIVAIISPKTVRAVAATLVQIEPGPTTHVGQNESQLVALFCQSSVSGCSPINPQGEYSPGSVYVVPTGYTLVITDWQFYYDGGVGHPGSTYSDGLIVVGNPNFPIVQAFATADPNGNFGANQRFTTGVRVASGVTVADLYASASVGDAYIQGYLVPN